MQHCYFQTTEKTNVNVPSSLHLSLLFCHNTEQILSKYNKTIDDSRQNGIQNHLIKATQFTDEEIDVRLFMA